MRGDLIHLYYRWFNGLAGQRTTRHPRLIPLSAIAAGIEQEAQSAESQQFTVYQLAERDGEPRPIGLARLKEIDFRNRTAEFEIVIGAPEARGRGYGTEATRLVLDYAFNVLSLHNVMLTVYANNPAGMRAYEKAGFRAFGRRTGAIEVAGERFDVIFMESLAATFESPLLRAIMLPETHGQGR